MGDILRYKEIMEVKEIIDKVYETIDSLYEEGLKNIYSKFLKFGSIEDLDNLILLYTNDIRKKVIDSYIEDGEDEEMAQFIVDYFEYIYGKRGEEE